MEITKMSLGPLGTNCYILSIGKESIIVDPGGDPERVVSHVEQNSLLPIAIFLTHGHFDHIGAVDPLREKYSIPVYIHENESEWLVDPMKNGSGLFQMGEVSMTGPDASFTLGEFKLGSFLLEIRFTPGHSPGSVSFVFPEDQIVISGDALFHHGIGRTDLRDGNMEQLINSIKSELFTLDSAYIVYPGHGPSTTIGNEKNENPFLR
jgi:hydroxyacylglutathione hydrolase